MKTTALFAALALAGVTGCNRDPGKAERDALRARIEKLEQRAQDAEDRAKKLEHSVNVLRAGLNIVSETQKAKDETAKRRGTNVAQLRDDLETQRVWRWMQNNDVIDKDTPEPPLSE
ncbi:MAG TPA: hypothetical protein VHE30_27185 [Polyangiaceae bacterium]|nr:hypothetical protein [Polyangiaceae bacterium]